MPGIDRVGSLVRPGAESRPLRILFYSGSIGLGHVTRDVAIAEAIRSLSTGTQIEWLASSSAREYLRERGERLHPEAARFRDPTADAEHRARPGRFNITRWALGVRKSWAIDGRLALSVMRRGGYDVVIGDEAYDVAMALTGGAPPLDCACFVLYDFLGLDRMSLHPAEWIGVEAINRAWARDPCGLYRAVFLGEPEDLSLRRFGLFGPSRRAWAERYAAIVGHALSFDRASLPDRSALRSKLGYGREPLLVASVGGTAIGADLLERCLEVFPLVRRDIPDLSMLLVGGPRSTVSSSRLPEGVSARGYVPRLYEHFAACDLAIVQGGGTTTLELTVLRRPFLFVPLDGHCEQIEHVAARQKRLGAGVRVSLRRTSPSELSRLITSTIGSEVNHPSLKVDGAREIARMVVESGRQRVVDR